MPLGGANTALVRKAFANAGYRLDVVTVPWERAVALGLRDSAFDGYFPEYLSDSVRRNCVLSMSVGDSPVVLAKRKSVQFIIHDLDDLSHYRVGVVNGYVNSDAFDANVKSGKQQVDPADSDEVNLQKLLSGRISFIVIDSNVMQWLMQRASRLQTYGDAVEALSPPLQKQNLYICFKPTQRGRALAKAFASGLKGIDIPAFTRNYLLALPTH